MSFCLLYLPTASLKTSNDQQSKLSGGCYFLLVSLEITTLPPASFRGASAKTSVLLVGTSRHLASTDPSAMISWQVLPRCFREQRFKSYVGSPGASARASASIMLPQNLPHASARTARSTFRERSQELFPYLSIGTQAPKKTVAQLQIAGLSGAEAVPLKTKAHECYPQVQAFTAEPPKPLLFHPSIHTML